MEDKSVHSYSAETMNEIDEWVKALKIAIHPLNDKQGETYSILNYCFKLLLNIIIQYHELIG